MSDYFPQEVLDEILLRLPVKTLLKCRCVSKTWHSIISDPTFITTHLTRTLTKTNNNNNMVIFHYFSAEKPRSQNEFFALYLDNTTETFTLCLDDTTETFILNSVPLNCPHNNINYFLSVVGSCNGVLCLADDSFGRNNGYALWNPSINKRMTVPDPTITFSSHGPFIHSLGFGFDAVNNDYKIVRIVYFGDVHGHFNTPSAFGEIFSLRSGSWHDVSAPGPNYIIDEGSLQAFVNGACHWVGHSHRRNATFVNVIVSFDLENEIFSEMKLPECLAKVDNLQNMIIAGFGGSSLALLPYAKWWVGESYSVWVMKEYGVAESWIKLFNIDLHRERLTRVVGFRKNGEVLVVTESEKLVSYDPENQIISDLGICVSPDPFYMDTYVESLVLLNEANGELQDQATSSNSGENMN